MSALPKGTPCSEMVWQGYHKYRCSKMAYVTRDGKAYCATHDPERVAARKAKKAAKWDREAALRQAGYDLDAARLSLVKAALKWYTSPPDGILLKDLQDACSRVKDAEVAYRAKGGMIA